MGKKFLTGFRALSAALLWMALVEPLCAKVYVTKDEALKLAFPEAERIERRTLFLRDEDAEKVEALSRAKLESRVFTYYVGIGKDGPTGYAFLGSHIVRTKSEVYMVVVTPEGRVKAVEILAFYEPEEYLPSKRWFDQFRGKVLDDSLRPKRGIDAVSGATMSVNSITSEVRKVLAIFETEILKRSAP